jgi:hypothetical protein
VDDADGEVWNDKIWVCRSSSWHKSLLTRQNLEVNSADEAGTLTLRGSVYDGDRVKLLIVLETQLVTARAHNLLSDI